MLEDNKRVVLECWEAANQRDAAGFDRVYDEHVIYHGVDGDVRGREDVKAYLQRFFMALPDIKLTVEDIFGEDDRVFSRTRVQGTHLGEINGIAPTGKTVDLRWTMCAARIRDGKIVEEWEICDQLEILRQLGVLSEAALA